MYFSKKNKNHMFNLLSKIVEDETNIDIKNNTKYIDLYQSHYSTIFEKINTDEISVLNKEVINIIGNMIIKDIKESEIISDTNDEKISISHNIHKNIINNENKSISFYSSQRTNDSLNRYNFKIYLDYKKFIPKEITILKENNSLFINPNINILFNDRDNIQFILKNTKNIGNNEYYIYETINEEIIDCDKILKIQIRNYLMIDPMENTDRYEIKKIKKINHKNNDYLCLEIDNHEIEDNDELGLLLNDKIIISLSVKKCIQNYILTNISTIDPNKKYSCLQINKNISFHGNIN